LAVTGANETVQDSNGKTDEARRRWVESVLGLDIGQSGASVPDAAAWVAARNRCVAADLAAKGQLAGLRQAMRKHPNFAAVAEFSLAASDGLFADLLRSLPSDVPSREQINELKKAVASLRKALVADDVVAACDDNPVGVKVLIRSTYERALDALVDATG
jgi:muconolactone delta-isomerase